MAAPIAIRTSSNFEVFHTPAMYPKSPILSFPPPAPTAGRPLAERAGMNLRIKTTFGVPNDTVKYPAMGHIQPHRNNLPRRRNPKRMPSMHATPVTAHPEKVEEQLQEKAAVEVLEEKDELYNEKFTPPEPYLPSQTHQTASEYVIHYAQPRMAESVLGVRPEDSDHLQELLNGLHLAFVKDAATEQPKQPSGKAFTHIVNVTYAAASESSRKGTSEQTCKDDVQRLELVLPCDPPTHTYTLDYTVRRAGLGLSDAQIRTARDFIAAALPRHVVDASDPNADVCVLVTAPHGRPADVMCVAAGFLAYTADREVSDILRFVDEEVEFDSIWRGEVSDDECARTQAAVRS
ncbi:hypothetical protein EIP91_011944 [Steccherinum ochraceum]|uniref:Uncharacterized protein n=1 Tax=Steccherinum ochraceum TaxID=92696 RepID=A0A4R0RVA7_9APHY|nr:hypothetical protein EIP91_011944 [Steccherinum ochraceum]